MPQPKFIFVLLHGEFHAPKCWDRLSAEIEEAGFSSIAPALSSSMSDSSTAPVPSWHEDVKKVIRETVSSLVRENDVVVVMHFTGSISGSERPRGAGQAKLHVQGPERRCHQARVHFVLSLAVLWREGICRIVLRNRIPGDAPDPPARVGTMALNHAKEVFYQDVDDETIAELAKDLVPLRMDFIWYRITNAAWRDTSPRTSCV